MQKNIILLFWRTAVQYPYRTAFAIIGSTLTTIVGAFLGPFIIAQVLDQLQSGNLALSDSMPLITMFVITQIYGQIVGWRLNLFFVATMETAGQRDLNQRVFSHLVSQSLAFHSNRFGGALVSQATKLGGAFERFWDSIIFQVIPSIVSVLTAVFILSFMFWQYSVVLLLLSIAFALIVIFGSKFLTLRNKEESKASTAVTAYLADAITNIATIKSHGTEELELKEITNRLSNWRSKSLHTVHGFLAVSTGYSSLVTVMNITALIGAIWASEHHLISIGTVYLSVTFTFTVVRQLWEMNSIIRAYNKVMGDAHEMTEILRLAPTIVDRSTDKLIVKNGTIDFDAVSFSHEAEGETLFDNFTLQIKGGERIGLVGRSGSGKTTLTKLLLRFVDIDGGKITIDNQDISQVTQESLRRSIAYVPQEPMLFHRTLRENIAYGKPNATEQEVYEAARKANAAEFIEKLPQQFETLVGERGIKLSGGQRQRIAIARAILKDAPILVLDEATSALDSESEKLIQDALEKLMKNRTSIVIAHRLSTIAKLDRIVVLNNGAISEQGTHSELLDKNGIYANLWTHQSGGFIEE